MGSGPTCSRHTCTDSSWTCDYTRNSRWSRNPSHTKNSERRRSQRSWKQNVECVRRRRRSWGRTPSSRVCSNPGKGRKEKKCYEEESQGRRCCCDDIGRRSFQEALRQSRFPDRKEGCKIKLHPWIYIHILS